MSGHRQAAVTLFGLAPVDQRKILAELPGPDQRILRTYLKELASLGFDAGASHVPLAAPAAQPALPAPGDAVRSRLEGASASTLLAVLEHEPATLIAQLLSRAQWPWAADLLALLPPHKRKLVREALEGDSVTPAAARDAFLIDALGAALADRAGAMPAAPRASTSVQSRWLPWTR